MKALEAPKQREKHSGKIVPGHKSFRRMENFSRNGNER
jgi:hypothetical protein